MVWLTKSRFLSGMQCHKRLWFEVHQPLPESVEPGMPILQGRSFDEVVQRLRPGAVVSRRQGLPAAIAETKRILAQRRTGALLYQAAFRAGDLAIITDVLRGQGAVFELVEVKASTEMKDIHLPDVAFQALVLQRAKIPVGRVFLGLVNNQFVLERLGDYEGLLAEVDVTEPMHAYLPEAAARALELQGVMAGATPSIVVGPHCLSPYECPFLARCSAGVKAPDYPVDVLPRGGKVVAELLSEGYRDLRDVPVERLTNDVHRRVFDASVSGLAFFDFAATAELRALNEPFAYLDFETISLAVPEIIGTRPFEQLPFQWSVHVEDRTGDVRHAEYLAIEKFGDFEELARRLVAALPVEGPVFAYNAGFEAHVLLRLAEFAPSQGSGLRAIAGRLVDLLPVVREAYYHRDMRGSWSIKSVMPTLDPKLDYEHLNEVQDGDGAQLAFLALRSGRLAGERAETLRGALLRYCQHDTWVMVILRRFLCGQAIGAADGG
jgi:Domain of unknown function(DUF2779)